MAGGTLLTVMLGIVAVLLLAVVVVLASIAAQLKVLRKETETARDQLMKMVAWSQLLSSGVQHLKEAGQALDTIDKRLQKLEALEKVQISHINVRAGR